MGDRRRIVPLMSADAASIRSQASRHRFLVILVWLQVPLITAVAVASGAPIETTGLIAVVLVMLATIPMLVGNRLASSCLVALALTTAAVLLSVVLDDAPMADLYLLFVTVAVSLYRDWRPLALNVAIASGYYLTEGLLDNRLDWAAIHIGFLVLVALTTTIGWRRTAPNAEETDTTDRLRLAFDEAPIGMATLKPSGEIIETNRAMAGLLQMDSDRLAGSNIRTIVHGDDLVELGDAWEVMGNDPGHAAVTWVRCMTGGGTLIWSRLSLSMVPWRPGRPAMVVLQLEDVTASHVELKRMERLLAAKDEFVVAVGSEIRQPLNTVIDLIDDGADRREIVGQVRQTAAIVDDLVASARASSGSTTVVALPIDVTTLCHYVVASVPGSDAVSVHTTGTTVWADPGLTRQILFGLVSNALRYGGEDVTVRATSSGPDTVISVIDNGAVIPVDERERMFAADLSHGQPVTRPAAVGLSLTVGRLLARAMDGDITYLRSGDGENVFELRLPSESLEATDDTLTDLDISV